MNLAGKLAYSLLFLVASAAPGAAALAAQTVDIGLAASGKRIDALIVEARAKSAPVVVLVGGLHGDDASAAAVRSAVASYEKRGAHPVQLVGIPLGNPDGVALQFPATGAAYRENVESNVLWRWIGAHAPDLVLIAGDDDAGLAMALSTRKVADMGSIPAQRWNGSLDELPKSIMKSEARVELERRRARSPREFAQGLAKYYGHDFNTHQYQEAMALISRVKLGEVDEVRKLVEPYVDGSKESLTQRPGAGVMAAHTLYTELARRTKDPRYIALVRKVGDLGFEPSGQMKEAMPYHNNFSDSVFMGTAIVAQAGALTGERKYFDMADRHLRFMQNLDLRPDGLYRHEPSTNMAWGRGNAFVTLGLTLVLTELPKDHPGYEHALQSYRTLMATLLPLQDRDGLWRNVLNMPGTYAEFTATAIIGFALQRGIEKGWIKGRDYRRAVDQAWLAVNSRTSFTGTFIDVCESTAKQASNEDYIKRMAILGPDPRAGGMAMLFATERM
ncbi:MAG TPA: glycoside hydrolase family 88 protein, partial [Steroidobacteraceae bacterium]|nr:glycoside hydrolase family 88 protein [Steroidobacteraceae bacterium]